MNRPSRRFAQTTKALCRIDQSSFADQRSLERAARRVAGLLAGHLQLVEVEACNVAVFGDTTTVTQNDATPRARQRARSSRRSKAEETKQTARMDRLTRRLARAHSAPTPALADCSAMLSERLWTVSIEPALPLVDAHDRKAKVALHSFLRHAVAGDVREQHITEAAAHAYAVDKWMSRCDKMCCALLCLAERCQHWPNREARRATLKVASIGGGPGNDAFGAFVFAALCPGQPFRRVEATVYDFSLRWQPLCEATADASVLQNVAQLLAQGQTPLLDLALSFRLCDLRRDGSAEVNQHVMESAYAADAAHAVDVFLFSHVVRESRACEHELLPALLRACQPGAVFVFLDMQRHDLTPVLELVATVERELERDMERAPSGATAATCTTATGARTPPRFERVRLGEAPEYGFFGLSLRREGASPSEV